jgi:1D-myo-inositol 3-kinase
VLGGSAAYATACAHKLGWESAMLTAAGADFEPQLLLPGVAVFGGVSPQTTRFINEYDEDGNRRQFLLARADDIALQYLPDEWRNPDVLLLCPVAGEIPAAFARGLSAEFVGATGQGWIRRFDSDGRVCHDKLFEPKTTLEGVHALFFSQADLCDAQKQVPDFLAQIPIVIITRGWEGATLYTHDAVFQISALPREEVDPTGAGDVFAAGFLVGYHEKRDVLEAAAWGACAASCVVEGVGLTALGDRTEVERRIRIRERLIEEGDWEE